MTESNFLFVCEKCRFPWGEKKKKNPNFLEDQKLNVFVLSGSKRSKQCDQSTAGIKCFLHVSLGTDDSYGSSVHLSEGDSIGETATGKQAELNPSS